MNCKNTCDETPAEEQPLTLSKFMSAVEEQIREQMSGVQTVAVWPDIRDHVQLPALLLELAEVEPGHDRGTGETPLVCRMDGYVIVAAEQAGHHQQAAHLATQLAVLLRAQYWDLDHVDAAEFVQAGPDWSRPELDGYTVWKVEWTQEINLGEEQWPWPDQPPAFLEPELDPDQIEIEVGIV